MKHVKKSVLLWYSPREMYDLVIAVEQYPQFLPWCPKAEVLECHETGMTARLHLAYSGLKHSFTTRNEHEPGKRVHMKLVDGPFSELDGTWNFVALGVPGDKVAQACRVEFELRYAFSGLALEAMLSPVFGRIANTFVDAFVKRAESVYGLR